MSGMHHTEARRMCTDRPTRSNIDLFAQHMCPQGAAHVPFRGAVKVCKRLQIDYAEAVVDFEFGHRMAVPVIQGVVIAEEHHDRVMEELQRDEAERARKEDEKRRKAALGKWRRFLMGMRIVERIRQDYGHIDDNVSVFAHSGARGAPQPEATPADEDMAGGFLPEGYEEDNDDDAATHHASGFFATAAGEDEDEGDGGLVMEEDHAAQQPVVEQREPTPEQPAEQPKKPAGRPGRRAAPAKETPTRKAPPRKSAARKQVIEDSEEDDEEWVGDSEED